MNNLKEKIKGNKVLYKGVKAVRYLQYGIWQPFVFGVGAFCRSKKIYALPIKQFHNKYHGKRCFILATGPSLTIEDVKALKNEYTFGMNSLVKIFDELGWETTFLGIQDYNVFGSLQKEIGATKNTTLFCGSNLKKRYKLPERAYEFPLDLMNHVVHPTDHYKTGFSEDCSVRVYDGYTITYSLIQLAVYLGFKEIYLLGCDCGYSGSKHHFVEHGVVDPNFATAQERMFFSYRYGKKYCDVHGIKIYNATRGGALEIFPRVQLEDVLKNTERI